jgi:hypothetical protein
VPAPRDRSAPDQASAREPRDQRGAGRGAGVGFRVAQRWQQQERATVEPVRRKRNLMTRSGEAHTTQKSSRAWRIAPPRKGRSSRSACEEGRHRKPTPAPLPAGARACRKNAARPVCARHLSLGASPQWRKRGLAVAARGCGLRDVSSRKCSKRVSAARAPSSNSAGAGSSLAT